LRHTIAFLAIALLALLLLNSAYCAAFPIKAIGSYNDDGVFSTRKWIPTESAEWERDKAALLNLKSKGIDTFLSGCGRGRSRYFTYDAGHNIVIPQEIKDCAEFAKQNGLRFFYHMWFVEWFDQNDDGVCDASAPKIEAIADKRAVYKDGKIGCMVDPWDEKYWTHLTNIAVALAKLDLQEEYRIDGIKLDFEFNTSSAYGDPHSFQEAFGDVADTLLEDNIKALAEKLRKAVHGDGVTADLNPDFLIGAYPSPVFTYLPAIYSGLSSESAPMVLFGTETYNGAGGTNLSRMPTLGQQQPGGYYNLAPAFNYSEPIYGYYVGGLTVYRYSQTNFDFYLYNIAKSSNGYWASPALTLILPFNDIKKDWQVSCLNTQNNTLIECGSATEYNGAVNEYLTAIKSANDALAGTGSIPQSSEEPPKVQPPIPIAVDFAALCPMAQPGAELSIPREERFWNQNNFIFKADGTKTVEIDLLCGKGYLEFDSLSYSVIDSAGNERASGFVKYGDGETSEKVSFPSLAAGHYALLVNPITTYFRITRTNVPIALYSKDAVHVIAGKSKPTELFFFVNDSVNDFSIEFSGRAAYNEGLTATIYKPTATGYQEACPACHGSSSNGEPFTLNANVPAESKNKIWKLNVTSTLSTGSFVSISFDNKIDPYFGLTDNPGFFMIKCCGNGSCDADAGETNATCPADCRPPDECVDTPTLMTQYIPQWKSGAITMLTLMQKMKLWNKAGCPPA
jgi:hypothetical protein